MNKISEIIRELSDFAWGPYMIIFLVGIGLYLTFITGFIQLKGFAYAFRILFKKNKDNFAGEITPFQALCTALSGAIGIGNIVGVATAIAAGGPGAIFWMWVTAIVGMATSYSECLLAVKYRVTHSGEVSGGPMYYLERGLGLRWLGICFAIFALCASFGIGNMVQANSVANALYDTFQVPKWLTGAILTVLIGLVIIGGIKRIAKVASCLVPFMVVIYMGGSLIILIKKFTLLPEAFHSIFYHALNPTAAVGGFTGAMVKETIRFGIARGLFSNEAGLGSTPIAHAAAKIDQPIKEGLVAMLGPFIDTIVVCTMTALVIIVSGVWKSGETGVVLSSMAYEKGIYGGRYIVVAGVVLFAFSTIISWSYYGNRCIKYLLGEKTIYTYKWLYVFLIFIGAIVHLEIVWNFSDVTNGLMAIPNLIALLGLSKVVAKETNNYFSSKN